MKAQGNASALIICLIICPLFSCSGKLFDQMPRDQLNLVNCTPDTENKSMAPVPEMSDIPIANASAKAGGSFLAAGSIILYNCS